jgi:CheY-like chemotaxis protein
MAGDTPGPAARALVVEDEVDVREMLRLVLGGEGYVVTVAADGEAALRALRSARFDVVTLDYRMPGLSGLETLARLKAVVPEVPVVMLSGYLRDSEAHRCLTLGAFAVVRKPFAIEDLLATIARARAAGSPAATRGP